MPTAIPGATGTSYVLTADDVGATITYRETATNAGGTATATSNALGPVAAAGLSVAGHRSVLQTRTAISRTVSLTGMTTGSDPQTGDWVFVFAGANSQSSTLALTTSDPGWTTETAQAAAQTQRAYGVVFHKVMGGTPDTTLTITGNTLGSDEVEGSIVVVLRGVHATTPLDVAAVRAGGTSSPLPNPGAITPATSGALVLAFGVGACAPGSVFTLGQPGSGLQYDTLIAPAGHASSQRAMALALGIYSGWTSGAVDFAAFTGSAVTSTAAWTAHALAIRPA